MSIIGRLGAWAKGVNVLRPVLSRLVVARAKWRDDKPQSLVGRFKSHVYACASRNAATVASVPLRLYATAGPDKAGAFKPKAVPPGRRKYLAGKLQSEPAEIVEITEHPALDLIKLANPHEIGFTLLESTVLYQELIGDAYWFLERAESGIMAGVPKAVYCLLSQYVKIVPHPDSYVAGYLYGNEPGKEIALAAEDVIHFRYPNPAMTHYGLSPLMAGLSAVDRSTALAQYEQALWDNNARPDFVVRVPEGTTDDDIERLYEQWERRFRGQKKAGKPWIATGEKGVDILSWNARDAGLIQSAKMYREEIYEVYGVPLTMGEVSKSRAEAEAGLYQYAKHAIAPRCRRLEQSLTEYLAPMFDSRLFFAFDDPVPADVELLLKETDTLAKNQILTRNELRQLHGYGEREDGDEYVAGGGGFAGPGPAKGATADAAFFRHGPDDPRLGLHVLNVSKGGRG